MTSTSSTSDVVAVVITTADCPYIDATLRSVLAQTCRPARIVLGVHGENAGKIARRVHDISEDVEVHSLEQADNFLDAAAQVDSGSEQWVWLLHSDSAPEVHCLQNLMQYSTQNGHLGVVGVKQVDWNNPYHLLEVGIRATRHARRLPDITEGEVDQGQHDERGSILGVGTAGMLISREVTNAIGGLSGALGPFGDGLEISRRVRNAGYDIAVCPDAKVRHARQSYGSGDVSFEERRVAQIYNALATWPRIFVPFFLAAYIVLGFFRACVRLITGNAHLFKAEVRAPWRVIPLRRKMRDEHSRIVQVRPPVSHEREKIWAVAYAKIQRWTRRRAARQHAEALDYNTLKEREAYRSNSRAVAGILIFIATAISVGTFLPQLITGDLVGGALAPDTFTASQLIQALASPWLASGDGYALTVDVFWLFFVPFTVLLGDLGSVTTWLIVLAIPLSVLTAYLGSRPFARSLPVRAVGAVLWGFAPPLLDTVNAGHVAGAVVHILLPVLCALTVYAWKGSMRALHAAAFVYAIAAAAAPIFLVLLTGLALFGMMKPRHGGVRWVWLLIPAYTLLAPMIYSAGMMMKPWRFLFTTPGIGVPVEGHGLSLLTLSPLTSVSWAQLASFDPEALARFIPVVFLVVITIFSGMKADNFRITRIALGAVVAGTVWAAVSFFVPVNLDMDNGDYVLLGGWSGIGMSAAFVGIWLIILGGIAGVASSAKARAGRAGAAVITFAVPVVLGVAWVVLTASGTATLLHAHTTSIPAVAAELEQSAVRARVLALYPQEDGIEAQIWRGNGYELHENTMLRGIMQVDAVGDADASLNVSHKDLADAIGGLAVYSEQSADVFARHAIAVVLIPASIDDVAARELRGQLNNTPGLDYVTSNDTGMFWRVTSVHAPSRLAVEDTDGNRHGLASGVYEAQAGIKQCEYCSLALAERADSRWKAIFTGADGSVTDLDVISGVWNQQWTLPSQPGSVHVVYEQGWLSLVFYVQVFVVVVSMVGAVFARRAKREAL